MSKKKAKVIHPPIFPDKAKKAANKVKEELRNWCATRVWLLAKIQELPAKERDTAYDAYATAINSWKNKL